MKFQFILITNTLTATLLALSPLIEPKGQVIEGSYLISLKNNDRITLQAHLDSVRSLLKNRSRDFRINHVYESLGKVYSAQFSKEVLDQIRGLEEISFIEKDSIFKINSIQKNAPWNLARLSQRKLEKPDYTYLANGTGVSVYVVDTGIYAAHPEFEGRVIIGPSFTPGNNTNDGHGHGTHCAGIIGAKTYGVAKKVQLISVTVFDASGSGATSGVIAGINWAVNDKRGKKGNVINLSIGGGFSQVLNAAVKAAYQKGLTVVVAAGNSNTDACEFSPGSTPEAITVASLNRRDERRSASNYGKCVDIFAPGENIISVWNNSGTNTLSGSSASAAHISGLAAYFYSLSPLNNDALTELVIKSATKDLIPNAGAQTPNLIAFNNAT